MRRQLLCLIPLTIAATGFSVFQIAEGDPFLEQTAPGTDGVSAKDPAGGPSCSAPSDAEADYCSDLERQILDTVVRLELVTLEEGGEWFGGKSHGTVMDGRYLLTHNHFGVDLKLFETTTTSNVALASLYLANGQKIQLNSHTAPFKVIVEGSETLLLDFGINEAGVGFFESLGLNSAQFKAGSEFQIELGTEVAQVDWNGSKAYIEWVLVAEINDEAGVQVLELSDGVLPGASGAGVFWQGYHIANNWKTVDVLDKAGTLVHQYSKAALNPEAIASALGVAVSD